MEGGLIGLKVFVLPRTGPVEASPAVRAQSSWDGSEKRACGYIVRGMLFTDLAKKGLKPVAGAKQVTGAVSRHMLCSVTLLSTVFNPHIPALATGQTALMPCNVIC